MANSEETRWSDAPMRFLPDRRTHCTHGSRAVKAVFASHTCMGSAFVVGSHHLARELAPKGHRVAAVSGISQVTFRCWWCPKGRGKLGEWRLMSGNITKGTGRPPKRSLRHARAYPNRSRDPFLGSEWFDPLEDAVRQRIRGFGAGGVRAGAALGGGRSRYGRQGRAVGYPASGR